MWLKSVCDDAGARARIFEQQKALLCYAHVNWFSACQST
jgi:hypothetical protein